MAPRGGHGVYIRNDSNAGQSSEVSYSLLKVDDLVEQCGEGGSLVFGF